MNEQKIPIYADEERFLFPIDNPNRIRHAWVMINHPNNVDMPNKQKIKNNIMRAANKFGISL